MLGAETRIVYTPSISRRYAGEVAGGLGVKITPYNHFRFSVGETFSKPKDSLREKRVIVLGTINPLTASHDVIRQLIMLDGLRRMEIKSVDYVILHMPSISDIAPLFRYVDSLHTIDAPNFSRVDEEHDELLRQPLISALNGGMRGVIRIPFSNIDPEKMFTSHFNSMFAERSFTYVNVISPLSRERPVWYSDLFPLRDNRASVELTVTKSMNGIKSAKAYGNVLQDVVVSEMEITSAEQLAWTVGALGDAGAKNVLYRITHSVFSKKVLDAIEKNREISKVVTTDSVGVPGEDHLDESNWRAENHLPSKFQVLSTSELLVSALTPGIKPAKEPFQLKLL